MLEARGLKILQYNIRMEADGVMAILLADKVIREYDILAIQEPWRNNPSKDIT